MLAAGMEHTAKNSELALELEVVQAYQLEITAGYSLYTNKPCIARYHGKASHPRWLNLHKSLLQHILQ